MNKHIDIVGLLYIVYGAMGLVALIAQAVFIIFGTGLINYNGDGAGFLFGSLGMIILMISAVASIPNLFVGYGLIKRRRWGRTFTIVWSVMNLFAFPLGTLLGGYAIWVMFQPEVTNQFAGHTTTVRQSEVASKPGV